MINAKIKCVDKENCILEICNACESYEEFLGETVTLIHGLVNHTVNSCINDNTISKQDLCDTIESDIIQRLLEKNSDYGHCIQMGFIEEERES